MGGDIATAAPSPPPPPPKNIHGRVFLIYALKLLLGLVFSGWMLMWIMMPTNPYKNKWWPKITATTTSTYFGTQQGPNMLIYTFPVLFISIVGCFLLHRAKENDKDTKMRSTKFTSHLEGWRRRPVLIKGPLGIVSAVELVFCLMFVALLIWVISMDLSTTLPLVNAETGKKYGYNVWQDKLANSALILGIAGNVCLAFLFFPVTRGSSILPLVGLTSEASIKYHMWLGHIALSLFTLHGLANIIVWIASHQLLEMMTGWHTNGISVLAGEISLFAGLIMWITTFHRIRRKMFELFFYTHNLYVLFMIFYLLHVGINQILTILPGLHLFMVDRFLRFLQSRQNVRLISARLLPSETVELNFSKSPRLSYSPLSIVFVNVPSVSKLQWHPFTVSSSSKLEPEQISVIIKKEGSWTKKLYQELSNPFLSSLNVSVEGPYGPASVDLQRHDTIVMVSGGSGITPFISIIRDLIHQSSTLGIQTPSIILIFVFKTSEDLAVLDLLLPISSNISDLSQLKIKIESYITREKAPSSEPQKGIRKVWFNSNPSHKPLARVLGPNSWLWLAVIISSSFVSFLLIIGILTRYYIYPIEQEEGIYSDTWRALLNLLFLCACIALASGVAVMWNKRKNGTETKQIHIMDVSNSPSSQFSDRNRELESLPEESLVRSTTVHYGRRPDLKKILLGLQGLSIGTMVSGPSGLRREVASICSSGQARNLHFESISFSW